MPKQKIVIIGAGPAGLTAGLELVRQGYQITILESSNAIGGISKTIRHNEQRIDIGGHRFFSKNDRVMRWWQDILPCQGDLAKDDRILGRKARVSPGGPDPEFDDNVFLVRHRVSRIYYEGKLFDYPPSLAIRTFANMGIATSTRVASSYLASQFFRLPEDSLENFYCNRFGRKLYSMFFEGYTEKVWGQHPSLISPDWGAQRVKGVSVGALVKNAVRVAHPKTPKEQETSLIEEFYYPKYGPGQLWEAVAKKIELSGGKLLKGKEVVRFRVERGLIRSAICSDGSELEGDVFISSMPLVDLVSTLGCENASVISVAKGLPYRAFVTVGLLVDRLALKNETRIPTLGDIVPDCWIYIQDASVKVGRIQIFNNWSPYMLADPEHSVWIGLEFFCNESDSFWSLSEDECVETALRELMRIGILSQEVKLFDFCRERVPKAYPAYFGTYSKISLLRDYLDSFENLYCVGRNGQHRYNNMDHSMMTSFAAVEAINGNASKCELWSVNTEQAYHEGR